MVYTKMDMKLRQLTSAWTVELKEDSNPQYGADVEDEVARILQEEIDWEILCDIMVRAGWTKVETTWEVKPVEEIYELKVWCDTNLTGHRKGRGKVWLFEKAEDAEWFMLRWS